MTAGVGGSNAAIELATITPWVQKVAPIQSDEIMGRLERARRSMTDAGYEALVVGAGASLNYFAGVSWHATERVVALLLTRTGRTILFAPQFEAGTLQASLVIDAECRFWEEDESPYDLLGQALGEEGAETVALDPALAYGSAIRLMRAAPAIRFGDATSIIDRCRMIKSSSELALLQQAKSMTLEVQRRAARILAPGITATQVRRFIDEAHRALGADGSSFCIVQFGRSTAYPHGLPGENILSEGDVVLIDTGCTIHGYNSDITRTYVFGEPDDEQRKIWHLEREAQQAAFDAVECGRTCEAIDRAARQILERAGLGPGYKLPGLPHRTGHGIGLSIHEAPYLVRGDRTPLAPGMCFSDEPMIVIPDRFGVRLEDHFYVTESGAEWFTEPSLSIDHPFDGSRAGEEYPQH